jgi:hypothetical protein
MGGSKTTIQAPPAPTPVDPGQSSLDYINAMSDPALQARLLASEQQFRPGYNELNLQDMQQYLLGTGETPGALDQFQTATERSSQIQADANSYQRSRDIQDVANLGPAATAAFFAANPQLQAQMQAAQGLSGGDPYAQFRQALMGGQPSFGDINYNSVSAAPGVQQGALGESLYGQAMGANGLGQVGQTLQGRAQTLAQSTGQLTPEEIRNLQQSTREGYAARGTEMGSGSISAEALARLTNERQRMQEDIGLAAALNGQNQSELGANRAFQQGVYGTDLTRQFQNNADTNQFSQFNAQNDLATQEANRAFAANQYQQGVSNLGILGQFNASQLGQDRNYALQLAQMQAAVASDPFQSILGRTSGALQYGAGQQGFAGGLTQSMQGPQLFDPNAGINLALQNNANQSNYQSSIFGAQAGLSGAKAGANGQMVGAGLGAAAGIGLAIF